MCLLQSQFRDLLKKIVPQKQVMGPFKELLWWPSHGPAWLLETPQKAPLPFLCLLTIHQWSDIIYEKVTITKLWWGRRSSFPRPIIAPPLPSRVSPGAVEPLGQRAFLRQMLSFKVSPLPNPGPHPHPPGAFEHNLASWSSDTFASSTTQRSSLSRQLPQLTNICCIAKKAQISSKLCAISCHW